MAANRLSAAGVEVRAEQAAHAHVLQEPHDADARGPETDLADDATVDIDAGALRRVECRRQHDDRRSVLVVVQHRPAEPRAQPLLDFEAGRRREILEQDGAEPRCDRGNVIDAARRIGLVEKDRHGVDVDERREKRRLAFHDRQPGERADVAEPEHGRPVGDDRDRVAEARVFESLRGILADREADPRDARRIDVAQDLLGRDRDGRLRADLPAAVPVEHAVRLADEARAGQRVDPAVEAAIRLFVHLQRDFPERAALVAPQRLEVVDRESRFRDHLQHLCEAARLMHGFDHQDLGNLHARNRTRSVITYAVINRREYRNDEAFQRLS